VYPVLGGHEGAGVITKVGPGVVGLEEGNHVVLGFIPACGVCKPCSKGMQNLCDQGANLLTGKAIADDTFRITASGNPVSPMCLLGTFSPYVCVNQSSVIKIEKDVDLATAALLGCGVSTGWGSTASIGGTKAGDVVVVVGVGGVGINAVQGARHAGAAHVVAVDPVAGKREAATQFGATHAVGTAEEARELARSLTRGVGASKAVITVGTMTSEVVADAFAAVGKAGVVVLVAMGPAAARTIELSGTVATLWKKTIRGSLFGDCNPTTDIPRLLGLYRTGDLQLDGLITRTYTLDQVNEGYEDLVAGRNIRGLIVHEH
jgi:S-(hydroxymethyl)glutathione dehydrogenase/alcohol dehydrogenase